MILNPPPPLHSSGVRLLGYFFFKTALMDVKCSFSFQSPAQNITDDLSKLELINCQSVMFETATFYQWN